MKTIGVRCYKMEGGDRVDADHSTIIEPHSTWRKHKQVWQSMRTLWNSNSERNNHSDRNGKSEELLK